MQGPDIRKSHTSYNAPGAGGKDGFMGRDVSHCAGPPHYQDRSNQHGKAALIYGSKSPPLAAGAGLAVSVHFLVEWNAFFSLPGAVTVI